MPGGESLAHTPKLVAECPHPHRAGAACFGITSAGKGRLLKQGKEIFASVVRIEAQCLTGVASDEGIATKRVCS